MDDEAKIGLVAIGRNEGERLKSCLRSVPHGVPIVYVDSASTDGSVDFARSIGARVVQLNLTMPFTAARARNAGLEAILRHSPDLELIQFVDGDCELEPGWLTDAERFLSSRPTVGAVCGRRRERFPERSIYNEMCDAEWDTATGKADACGGAAMFRAQGLAQVHGYYPAIIAGEEPELCFRLRGCAWQVWRAVRSGFGYAQVWQKTRGADEQALHGRQAISALGWTVGVALIGILLSIAFGPLGAISAPLLWLIQFARLSWRGIWGWHILIGKFAETLGILRFAAVRLMGKKQGAIFYK